MAKTMSMALLIRFSPMGAMVLRVTRWAVDCASPGKAWSRHQRRPSARIMTMPHMKEMYSPNLTEPGEYFMRTTWWPAGSCTARMFPLARYRVSACSNSSGLAPSSRSAGRR